MRSSLRKALVFGAAVVFGLPGPARGGVLSPALEARMASSPAPPTIRVIVHLREQAPLAALQGALKIRGARRATRHRETVSLLKETARRTQDPLVSYLRSRLPSGSVLGYTPHWISNLIVLEATPEEIARVAARSDVDWVELDFRPRLIAPIVGGPEAPQREGIGVPPGIRAIRAPEVWNELGITGAGTIVANLDTGVDGDHPALAERWRGYGGAHPPSACWLDVIGFSPDFPSESGNLPHGTHVMGTLCGLGAETGDTVGVAWGAQWIACNAIGEPSGPVFDNDVIRAFEWFADPDGDPETDDDVPDVVQNSWGVNPNEGADYTTCDQRWWAVIDNCEAAGVVVTWSAGNEGERGLRSPANRATSPTNSFSIGAVDATHSLWPYPIASFSSRGPTNCPFGEGSLIKPEVCAPGVDVYSSVDGGGYSGSWSGTSMAGPHAAGIVALMREANPELDVESIKRILMETARDLGYDGEDNTFGWGFVDAYAAVMRATEGFGHVAGRLRNAGRDGAPVDGGEVVLLGTSYRFAADHAGAYRGTAPAATYRAVARAEGFGPDTAVVEVRGGELSPLDFDLIDVSGPSVLPDALAEATTDTTGPYVIRARIEDPSAVAWGELRYRTDPGEGFGPWVGVRMDRDGDRFEAEIPGAPAGTLVEYYIRAADQVGLESAEPPGGADAPRTLMVRSLLYATGFEEAAESDWTPGAPDDDATSGFWVRVDPVGTRDDGGRPVQPEDDATPDPGRLCFVTGNGPPGGSIGDADVDDGCVTLLSPVFDLSAEESAFVRYARWFGEGGASADDTFRVDVSGDGGETWVPLERISVPDTVWIEAVHRVDATVGLSAAVRFRFRLCDLGLRGVAEAAVDDFALEAFTPRRPGPLPDPDRLDLLTAAPNPAAAGTTIRLRLPEAGSVRVEVFGAAGGRVRRLISGRLPAGETEVPWDARDDRGRRVAAGIYYVRLVAGAETRSLPVVIF